MDSQPPKKQNQQKPNPSVLMNLIENSKYALPGIGTSLAARDLISKFALGRMAENLDPFDYGMAGFGRKGTVGRFIDAVVLNKKEEPRAETEQFLEKGYGMKPSAGFKERVDLLQMLAGKPQKYNTIQPSQYEPTIKTEEGKKYYSSKSLESQIAKELDLPNKSIKSQKDVVDMITAIASVDPDTNKPMIGRGGVVTTVPGLGQATYGVGRDAKGIYLSYGDVWDLDPSSGASSDIKKGSLTSAEGIKNIAKKGLTKIGSELISSKATPTNVYGRIYFDPKTGKPIL